jgi:hypothetical protein
MTGDGATFAELEAYKCTCEDHESVVSPTAYLADLLDYATADGSGGGHVKDSDGSVSIDDLERTFHQPFDELAAKPESAQETVRHVRICVEALLGYLDDEDSSTSGNSVGLLGDDETGEGIPDGSETEAYRTAAYEALLDEWGVTRDDLRTAAYDESERGWIADTIGVPEWTVPDLWLDPDAPLNRAYEDYPKPKETSLFESIDETFPVSETNLEDLFGLPAVTKPTDGGRKRTDPLRTIEEPYVRMWRIQYLGNEWAEEDHPSDAYPAHLHQNTPHANAQIDSESTRPIVDPDLIGPDDFRVVPGRPSFSRRDAFPGDDAAFSLWETRRTWLDEELESIWEELPTDELLLVEVQTVPAGSDSASLNDEYVVLENTSGELVDLTGYRIEDDAGHEYAFPAGVTLNPGTQVAVHTGADPSSPDLSEAEISNVSPGVGPGDLDRSDPYLPDSTEVGPTDLYWGASGAIWNTSGDTVHVFDDQDSRVLSTAYSGSGYVDDGGYSVSYDRGGIPTVLNEMLGTISYSGHTGEQVWYAGHQSSPPDVPETPSSGTGDEGPLVRRGFLQDFDRLYSQLTGERETATRAREERKKSQYPTGPAEDPPAEAARTVVNEELHLSESAFRRLVDLLRKHYGDEAKMPDEEWWEVASIIADARKRSLFDVWITEESDETDVHLDRTTFWQSQREPRQGEWSLRLDRHDPLDPDEAAVPFIDPDLMNRSDLPERPRGEDAHELYETRQERLRKRRASFTETFDDRRRTLQSTFESLREKHERERERLTSGGSVPKNESTIDGILAGQYGSVTWPESVGDGHQDRAENDWEARISWLHEGLQLAKRRTRSGSDLSSDEQQQITEVEVKLDDLRLSNDEFRQLHRLRERAKLTGPDDEGLSPDEIGDLFAVLPLGNPLDPVLTTAYEPKKNESELQPIYADPETPHRWDPLFDEIAPKLEDGSTSNTGQRGSVPPELDALGLSVEEFESVLSLRRRARPGPDGDAPSEALVSEVIRILTSVWKRNEHYPTRGSNSDGSDWVTEETEADVDDYWDARKARLPKWRATPEDRAEWQRALYRRSSAPIVDPDLLRGVDDFETPAWKKDGFDLWNDRTDFLSGSKGTALVSEIEQLRTEAQQGNHKLTESKASRARTDIDVALERTVGVTLSDLRTIAEEMERGNDVGIRLARLDLTPSALSYVLEIDDHLGTQPIRVEEWESLQNILLRAWKQRQYGRWNREERALGVVLEPQQFDLPDPDDDRTAPDEDDPLRWRVEWSIRSEWEDVLETRTDQLEEVDDEIAEAVAAAERDALPVLRDTLIDRADTSRPVLRPPSNLDGPTDSNGRKAEWLSERLLVDTEMHGGRETTRTSQAITSLQDLLQSLDLHLDDRDSGLDDAGLSLDDDEFDRRWQWLGTYDRWKAAMGVYVHPENVLLPTLRRRTTETFDRIAGRLSRDRDLTASRVSEAAAEYREYLENVMHLQTWAGCMAPEFGSAEDDSRALAYVFAESLYSGMYYFTAFDPMWEDHRHGGTTWTRIEPMSSAATIEGATTYEDSIYLFVSARDSGGSEGQGSSENSGNVSSEREKQLKYLRYDIREQRWSKPQKIELPDEVDGTKLTKIEDIEVVLFEGWDQPPEVSVDFDIEGVAPRARLFVQFDSGGTPPDTNSYSGVHTVDSFESPITTIAIDDNVRVTFDATQFHVSQADQQNLLKSKVYQDYGNDLPIDDVVEVIYRPKRGNSVVLVPVYGKPVLTLFDWGKEPDLLFTHQPDRADMVPLSLSQCNNVVSLPNNVNYSFEQKNEVLIATGSTDYPISVPVTVTATFASGGEKFLVKPDKELAPAMSKRVVKTADRTPWPYGPRLADDDDLSGDLADHAASAEDILDATEFDSAKSPNLVYVAEAYYYLPLFLARQLTRAGEYDEALRWFRTVYDFTASGTSSDPRAIWPELEPDPPGGGSKPGTDWLLDPIDPHAIAETRSNPYTKFTVFSIVRCLSEYGDDEFAQDTPKSVANATDLYEQALDLLDEDVLHRDADPCRSLVARLNTSILAWVTEPEIWKGDPELTRTEVEAKTNELVRVVRGIDDYTDRRQAVTEIQNHLESGNLDKALDVANEWQEPEHDESPFGERITTVIAAMKGEDSGHRKTERDAVDVANAVKNRDEATGNSKRTGDPDVSKADLLEHVQLSADNIDAAGFYGTETALPVDRQSGLDPADTDTEFDPIVRDVGADPSEDSEGQRSGETSDGENAPSENSRGEDAEFVEAEPEVKSIESKPSLSEEASTTVDAATMNIIEATKHQFCVPKNPLLDSLRRHAEVNLEKIRSGRTIAGMKRELDPYASSVSVEGATPTPSGSGAIGAAEGDVQATNYRYEALIERAKELAKQARRFESELLTAIEKADREEYKLEKARQQVELAEQRVSLQETRMERARGKVELARLKRERAGFRKQRYDDWIDNPLWKPEEGEKGITNLLSRAARFHWRSAEMHELASKRHRGAAAFSAVAGVAGMAAASGPAGALSSLASGGSGASSSAAAARSSKAAAYSALASRLSTKVRARQIEYRRQLRARRRKLKRDIAKQNYEIGTQRMEVARDTVDIVQQEQEIAQLRADHAEDIVNFHENKFTSEELFQWIADVLEGVYRYFLQQAASVAKMAQRQLAFERQGLPREFVQSDYWEAPTRGRTAVPATQDDQGGTVDRRGMTGSARLLQDIYELDGHEFRTDQRRLQVEKTVSVAELDPMALQQFRETGVLSFATTLEDFDVDHPGHYHRMIEDVEVTVVALTPPTEGINATLSNSGTSRIVVGDTLFKERTIDRDPETIVLNRARSEAGDREMRLRPRQREKLGPFEQSGVATDWELEMPRPANDMDYSTIVDVQLTIEYSALESYDYRQQVLSELDPERIVERSFSFHDDFADAWYELVNAPAGADSTTVRFDTGRDDFPSNLYDLSLESARLYFVVPGPNRADKREDLKDLNVEFGPADGSGTESKATNGTVDLGSIDTDTLDREWELTVTPTGMDDPFADGTVEDVLLIVTAEGEAPNWPP